MGFATFLILTFSQHLSAQQPSENQTTTPQYRELNSQKINRLLENDDFVYQKDSYETYGPWQRFQQKLQDILHRIFGQAPSGNTIENVFYILAALLLIWAILKILGIEMNSVFRKTPAAKKIDYQVNEENIHEIHFQKEIEKARTAGQNRLVVRLQYLWALKKLSDQNQIKVERGKTNQDYRYEVRSEGLKEPFSRLSRIFEYTWYGHFEADENVLQSSENELHKLNQHLRAA